MRTVDVAVVGAGPAGIAAALASAEHGANTLLLDENPSIGGQLRWRLTPTMDADVGLGVDPAPGPLVAEQLGSKLKSTANLSVEPNTVAWGLFEDNVLGISTEDGADEVQANAIILATGSTDVTLPFPGWTLPGVMTARAVQIFAHVHRVLPGDRWAILGDTPEANEVAADLERCGAAVVSRTNTLDRFRASGTNRLTHVEIDEQVHEVDGLAIALGRQPDPELAVQAQAAVTFDWELGGYAPMRDASCMTSLPGIYVVGDAAGVGSLAELVAEGRVAGLSVAGADANTIDEARRALDLAATEPRRSGAGRLRLTTTAS